MTRAHPHTTILLLNHKELQHFSALMRLRSHPPGEEKDDATYFVIKVYNEADKEPAAYRIHIFERCDTNIMPFGPAHRRTLTDRFANIAPESNYNTP